MKNVLFLTQASHSKFTRGKRSPEVPPGVLEYQYTRDFLNRLMWACFDEGLNAENITPGPYALQSIAKQAEFVNYIVKRERKTCAFAEFHLNAKGYGKKWYKANGSVIWISRRASKESKMLAKCVLNSLGRFSSSTGIHTRRGIKQANHTITTATDCPAILVELGFMTSKVEVERLRENIVFLSQAVADGFREYQEIL